MSFRGAGITATEIKIGAQHEALNACSFLASPLAALLSPSLYLAQLDMLTSFAPRALLLGPSWYDQSYTVPMRCSGLEKLSPDLFMMLMMHYSASIASLASPDPIFTAFLTLALERSPPPSSGFTLSKCAFSRPPPPHPLNSLRSLELKPSLSAGFRNVLIYVYNL